MMKHLLTIIAFSIIPLSVLGQIRYEGTHDEGYKSFQLDNGELKYAEYNKSGTENPKKVYLNNYYGKPLFKEKIGDINIYFYEKKQ